MAIEQADVKIYPASTVSDASGNGGRMNDSSPIADSAVNGFFPNIYSADRAAGLERWRKLFVRYEDSADADGTDSDIYLNAPYTDGVGVYLRPGDFTDTQGGQVSSRYYGVGALDANLSATDTSIDINLVDATITQFADGDIVYFINSSTYAVIETGVVSGTPAAPVGSVQTITLASGVTNAMTAGAVNVASAWRVASVAKAVSSFTDGSAAGTLDDTQIAIKNQGGVYQVWTITFTSATAFDLSGDTLGAVSSGTVGSTFEPNNPNTSTPYFSIPTGAWSGTHATSDTYAFTTSPCGQGFWLLQDVPSGASAGAGAVTRLAGQILSA